MNNPANIGRYQFLTAASDDALLSEAARSFSEIRESVESLAGNKREYYSLYDIPGIDRIVNICHWGRSGSLLLASFLDNHDHVLMLPFHQGEKIYAFLSTYGHLPLWDQLIAYPTYARSLKGDSGDFFVKENELGNFAIEPTDYYAAVCAMADFHRGTLEPWMKSRVGFFRALHVVYAVALGRRPATARPIIVYAQHWPNDELAQCLVEDFPKAQFLHTVRDPLTAVGSWFDGNMDNYMYCYNERPEITPKYLDAATIAMVFLLTRDQGHPALAEVTRALRFEDMHLDPEGVMRRVATWLNIPYSGRLLESSGNGNPYVVNIRGRPTCGSNPANAKRRTTYLGSLDQAICFALFYRNFVAWGYDSPRSMQRRWYRVLLLGLALLKPLNIEFLNARTAFKLNIAPALRRGRVWPASKAVLNLFVRRLRMMILLGNVYLESMRGRRKIMRLI